MDRRLPTRSIDEGAETGLSMHRLIKHFTFTTRSLLLLTLACGIGCVIYTLIDRPTSSEQRIRKLRHDIKTAERVEVLHSCGNGPPPSLLGGAVTLRYPRPPTTWWPSRSAAKPAAGRRGHINPRLKRSNLSQRREADPFDGRPPMT
jgi:hypothetical protein